MIDNPEGSLERIEAGDPTVRDEFNALAKNEKLRIEAYLSENAQVLSEKYNLTLTRPRMALAAAFYCRNVIDIDRALTRIKSFTTR